jgi:cystathionine beta-lyase/cystathionine gamma-synthase
MKKKMINSSRMPLYRDAGFELFDAKTTSGAFAAETKHDREPGLYIYSRYRNPTVVSAENEIMKLEGSKWSLLSQSGMSAIDIAFSIFQQGNNEHPWLLFSEIYGGTISFAENILRKRRGLNILSFFSEDGKYDLIKFENSLKKVKPQLLYIESISNPMLIVPDAEAIIRIAKRYKVTVIVDNTFATPYLWKPLESGADLVIHSATKYFSGHGNLTAGVICGNSSSLLKRAIEYRKFVGHMLSADDAYRLQTQLQTFSLRFMRQCSNASTIASLLSTSDKVCRVWYPGLKEHPTHVEAKKLFKGKGFGAMVTFDFAGESDAVKRKRRDSFIKAVSDHIRLIPTLGDPHTILMPVEAVWGAKYPEPGMIRLSAGFENTDELVSTIMTGLNLIK